MKILKVDCNIIGLKFSKIKNHISFLQF